MLQEATQPLAAADFSLGETISAVNDLVADSLVGAFGVVVIKVRVDRPTQGRVSEEDHPAQALRLDRKHEPLGVRVAVGSPITLAEGRDDAHCEI